MRSGLAVDADFLEGKEVRGKAVLFFTGWSAFWGTPSYFQRSPHLSSSMASLLVSRGAAIVGIDSHNIDDTEDMSRPVHSILLRAGIPVVEHLANLEALPPSGFRFYAVPVKVAGMGTFPVRAFAEAERRSKHVGFPRPVQQLRGSE